MIQSSDVGSLPTPRRLKESLRGASCAAENSDFTAANFCEQAIVAAYIDKLKAGVDIPTFPQFRDMSKMFLSTFKGIKRLEDGYIETGLLGLKSGQARLPEVVVIEKNSDRIYAETNKPFQLRICITGPYTLASSFLASSRSQIYEKLGRILSKIVEVNAFAVKHGRVALMAIDEPLFGLIDDPSLDRGSEGRESLLEAWEAIASKAKRKKMDTCIHLHSTSDDLFWSVKSLSILESHVNDPFYKMKTTKQRLEKEDKLLKASIAITDFDQLIKRKLASKASDEIIANTWKLLSNGKVKPEEFLESIKAMAKRLKRIIGRFGYERVALAGPECGLQGFPTYNSAINCLKLVSKAVELIKKQSLTT
jgi:5-methyltetrahydropteroyltriglutamate--homocysteine methyltransferase